MILTVLGITLPFFILIFLGAFLRFSNFLTDQNSNLLSFQPRIKSKLKGKDAEDDKKEKETIES